MLAEINVVPYIDVMLVLLIIFMVSAPLLIQGVEVALPQASSAPLDGGQSIVISLHADGRLMLDTGDGQNRAMQQDEIMKRVALLAQNSPQTAIWLRGDRNVPYGQVIALMSDLQEAGVADIGLITEPMER